MKIALSVVGVLVLAVVLTVVWMDWLIIDVHESGPDGTRLWIPIPKAALRLAVRAVPDRVMPDTRVAEFAEYRAGFRAVADELVKMPDAALVEVTDGPARVVIRKEGDLLLVEVNDATDEVSVRVPVAALGYIADAYDGERFDPAKIVKVIDELPEGDFVHVREPGAEVRLSIR